MKVAKILILIFILAICSCAKQEQPKHNVAQVIPVRVEKIKLRDLNKTLEYVGSIKAQGEAVVYPKVSGKIMEKLKEEGSSVDKSEVIAYIDRDEVGLKFEKAPVESPLGGVVGRVYVDIGATVVPQTPVALVMDMDKVKISLDIPEQYLPQLQLGSQAKVTVDAYAQEEFSGQITKISPMVNLENRAAPIEITIANPAHRLKSGMFARVALLLEQHRNIPVILKESILGKAPDNYVYLVKDNRALMRKVGLGMSEGYLYEVTDGLEEGDLVVVMGQQRLYDQAPVSVEFANNNVEGDNR
jgi:membrane fusion protein (multidrug efflux system)